MGYSLLYTLIPLSCGGVGWWWGERERSGEKVEYRAAKVGVRSGVHFVVDRHSLCKLQAVCGLFFAARERKCRCY